MTKITYKILLLSLLMLFLGCRDFQPEIVVDNYINFLDLSEEQEKEIRPRLEDIHNQVHSFFEEINTRKQNTQSISKQEELKLKIDLMDSISPVVNSIMESLNDEQMSYWARSELYYFYAQSRMNISEELLENYKIPYKRTVPAELVRGEMKFNEKAEYIDNWTIYFGQNTFPFYYGKATKGIKGGRMQKSRFPIGIQATIVDSAVHEFEDHLIDNLPKNTPEDPYIELRAVLSTTRHPNFIDIENWVVFIETSEGIQIEPIRVEKKTRDWFFDRELLYASRLPEFMQPRIQKKSDDASNRNMRRGGGAFQQYNTYYQLFFPAKISGNEILSPDNDYIKLVFL
ncbi:MAG: hypothetical protein GY863_08275, partial [bacterium]|nr:hypothetical protein [bacterium]